MEELIFGGAYVRREICISKLIGLAYSCSWKEIYHFCFVLLCIRGQFPSTGPQGVIFGGGIKWRVLCVTSLGDLYSEGLLFGILRYVIKLILKPGHLLKEQMYYVNITGDTIQGNFQPGSKLIPISSNKLIMSG